MVNPGSMKLANILYSLVPQLFIVMAITNSILQFQLRGWFKQNHPELSDRYNNSQNLKKIKLLMLSPLNTVEDKSIRTKLLWVRITGWTAAAIILTGLLSTIYLGVKTSV